MDLILYVHIFRTTNGPESFYRTYIGQFYNPHPPTHAVISILKKTQAQTLTIINSIKNNVGTYKNYNGYKIY
jgi:hypothetical protein